MSRFDVWEGWQGWRSHQGWRNQQGWRANQGWSGADLEASGMVVEGMIRSRESLVLGRARPKQPPQDDRPLTPSPRKLPALDAGDDLFRCADDVRTKVLVYELLEPLVIKVGDKSESAELWIRNGGKRVPLACIQRPDRSVFEFQVHEVEDWAARRTERASEILSQMGPQMAYWSAMLSLGMDRTPHTLEWCDTAMVFASFVVQRVKQILNCPRPSTYSATLQPMIPNPGFTALPSGHATEAFMMARILRGLLRLPPGEEDDQLLQRLAHRITMNRVVAGLHFPVDNIAGRMLGECLAEYFLLRCGGGDGCSLTPRQLNAKALALHVKPFGDDIPTEGFVSKRGEAMTALPLEENSNARLVRLREQAAREHPEPQLKQD